METYCRVGEVRVTTRVVRVVTGCVVVKRAWGVGVVEGRGIGAENMGYEGGGGGGGAVECWLGQGRGGAGGACDGGGVVTSARQAGSGWRGVM